MTVPLNHQRLPLLGTRSDHNHVFMFMCVLRPTAYVLESRWSRPDDEFLCEDGLADHEDQRCMWAAFCFSSSSSEKHRSSFWTFREEGDVAIRFIAGDTGVCLGGLDGPSPGYANFLVPPQAGMGSSRNGEF